MNIFLLIFAIIIFLIFGYLLYTAPDCETVCIHCNKECNYRMEDLDVNSFRRNRW